MQTLIHIGAGTGTELTNYQASQADQIILIEPQPNLAKALTKATAKDKRFTIIEAAITPNGSGNTLYQYNLPEANSLYPPAEALKNLYPGLKQREQLPVTTLSPNQLLAQIQLNQNGQNTLVIEAPGAELGILVELAAEDALANFKNIQLTCPNQPYYQSNSHAQAVVELLEPAGFELQATPSEKESAEWPQWQFAYNPWHAKLTKAQAQHLAETEQLKAQLQQAQQQVKDQEKANKAQKEKAEQTNIEIQARLEAELEAEQKALTEQKKEQETKLQEADKYITELKAKLKEAQQKTEELQNTSKAQQVEHQKALQVLKNRLNEAESAEVQATKERVAAEQSAKKEKDEAQKQIDDLKQSLVQANEKTKEQEQILANLNTDLKNHKEWLNNRKKELEELKNSIDDVTKVKAQLHQALEENQKLMNKQDTLQKELEQEKIEKVHQHANCENIYIEKLKEQLAKMTEENETSKVEADLKLVTLQESHQNLEKELIILQTKLEEREAAGNRFDQLEKKLSDFGSVLNSQLDRKLINTAQQIESTIGLQSYLSTGELPLSYHGWPISPDLALYLTEKIERENFDLIIEFGSGTSTVLFAKVILKKILRQRTYVKQKRISGQQSNGHELLKDAQLPDDTELPKRVLTFEHNRHYFEQTSAVLSQAGVEQIVNLVHTPLVDYSYHSEDFLYYDCDISLRKIAEIYENRVPRILVLVDGPPGTIGRNARFPALPKLLNILPNAIFDVVLDDYNRAEEKAVVDKWIELIEKRSLNFSKNEIPLEKGAICISIG